MKSLQHLLLALGLGMVALMASASPAVTVQPVAGLPSHFILGADVSMLDQLEQHGARFSDAAGRPGDAMGLLKAGGMGWIRLRLWHTPVNAEDVVENGRILSRRGEPVGGGNNDLATTVRLAQRAKAAGLRVLLDLHYSDFWADPGKQNKPAAWRDLHGEALAAEVHRYTRTTLAELHAAGAFPDMVQVGNELNGGMLWPDGKTWRQRPDEWIGGDAGFVALLSAGIRAVREADAARGPAAERVKVAVHLADGGDNALYRRVFDMLTSHRLDYDLIGLSYYPYWHGTLAALQANMNDISQRYGKPVAVLETAYAHTLANGDDFPNLFDAGMQETAGYLATPQGQATAVRDVIDAVAKVPDGRGIGVFYWAPDWIAVPGAGWRTGDGNGWDNQALFDTDGRALPSLQVFRRVRDQPQARHVPRPRMQGPVTLTAYAGQPWVPPSSLRVLHTDDALRPVPVEWDGVDPARLARPGRFLLRGRSEALPHPVLAMVQVVERSNYFDDPGFELGDLAEWTLTGAVAAVGNEHNPANAHGGVRSLHYWSGEPFAFTAERRFAHLPDGRYVLRAWSMGGGGENALTLYARGCGDGAARPQAAMNHTGWQQWSLATVPDTEVRGGACTVGIAVDAPAGTWGNIDDLEFVRVEQVGRKTPR